PSWEAPADALRSSRARQVWTQHAKFCVPFDEIWPGARRAPFEAPARDISAGRWREVTTARPWPACHPQHERRKYLLDVRGRRTLLRFVGLGRFGKAALERSRHIAAAGFSVAPLRLVHGFIERPWIEATPLRAADARHTLV